MTAKRKVRRRATRTVRPRTRATVKPKAKSKTHPTEEIIIEHDLARSAWYDRDFAAWFTPYVRADLLFGGSAAAEFFKTCGEFALRYKSSAAGSGDEPQDVLEDEAALRWFETVAMPKLPGGANHKPTQWQMEKARKYLNSRNNALLAQTLLEAEKIAENGDQSRADALAADARRKYTAFTEATVECRRALSDEDAILGLAEHIEPYFTLEGELGRILNHRLKPDNFGIILANQKVGKTTFLVNLAIRASKRVPTLLISAGDESELKLNARIATHISNHVTQPEFEGEFALPVPDCEHNAQGTCPLELGGEPRSGKGWLQLIEDGHTPEKLLSGNIKEALTVEGNPYQPCCRCFPMRNDTKEEREQKRHWKSAIWWQMENITLMNRNILRHAKSQFQLKSEGDLRIMAFGSDQLTPERLMEILEVLDRRDDFVPSVIVIDYADIMKQSDGMSGDKDHDRMRRIFERLSALRLNLGNLTITATQANREGDEVETHTMRTVGRTAKGVDNCTWFLTLNQTIAEGRAKVMRASMMAAREGRFDPERQALCCQWYEVQDAFAFSMPVFKKITKGGSR